MAGANPGSAGFVTAKVVGSSAWLDGMMIIRNTLDKALPRHLGLREITAVQSSYFLVRAWRVVISLPARLSQTVAILSPRRKRISRANKHAFAGTGEEWFELASMSVASPVTRVITPGEGRIIVRNRNIFSLTIDSGRLYKRLCSHRFGGSQV